MHTPTEPVAPYMAASKSSLRAMLPRMWWVQGVSDQFMALDRGRRRLGEVCSAPSRGQTCTSSLSSSPSIASSFLPPSPSSNRRSFTRSSAPAPNQALPVRLLGTGSILRYSPRHVSMLPPYSPDRGCIPECDEQQQTSGLAALCFRLRSPPSNSLEQRGHHVRLQRCHEPLFGGRLRRNFLPGLPLPDQPEPRTRKEEHRP